ncbi:hypothetical protein DF142_09535 [Burkholderia cenocepacia]|nr:hypothetical protein DF142_09535 [Burkholderia cenocepacia]RQU68483.1 hypothetical protein DF140_11920 [Burkholderia cenocepacia]
MTWKLPMVFFCENNGLIADYAAGYGVPGVSMSAEETLRPDTSDAASSRPGSLSWEGPKRPGFRPFAQRL